MDGLEKLVLVGRDKANHVLPVRHIVKVEKGRESRPIDLIRVDSVRRNNTFPLSGRALLIPISCALR